MDITTQSVTLGGEDINIPAFLVTPEDEGIYPGG